MDDEPGELCYRTGTSAHHDWQIYRESHQNGTLFHLDKFPSPYVIANVPIGDLTNQQIRAMAQPCKSKSKYKNLRSAGVFYTPASNTRPGEAVGSLVVLSNRKKKIVRV